MVDRAVLASKVATIRDAVARIRGVLPPHPASFAADRDAREIVALNLLVRIQDGASSEGRGPGYSAATECARSGATAASTPKSRSWCRTVKPCCRADAAMRQSTEDLTVRPCRRAVR